MTMLLGLTCSSSGRALALGVWTTGGGHKPWMVAALGIRKSKSHHSLCALSARTAAFVGCSVAAPGTMESHRIECAQSCACEVLDSGVTQQG